MIALVLTTIILSAAPVTYRQFREVAVYDGHVTLEIPAEWNEIPPEVLEFHSLRAIERSGGRMTEFYQHGFRPDDPEIDFALPQVLIQIKETGRLRYYQFLRMPSEEALRAEGETTLSEHAGPLLRGLEIGDAVFDMDHFALHLRNTLDLSLEGEAVVDSVAFLTERGTFTVHSYAGSTDMEKMEPVFEHIIGSVRFDDELRYSPRLADRWPPHPAWFFIAAAALIAAVAVLVHLLKRGRRQP